MALTDFGSLAGFVSLEGIASLVLASVGVSIVVSPSAPVFRALGLFLDLLGLPRGCFLD
jgi:hypothetical protein